ncbi:MAG: hypothetical protein JJE50_10470 [Actinomycetales bacterium]|nr:hypothetical protein [Actinomycetales bacterium]
MRRLFWVGIGVAATVVVLRQVAKVNDRVSTVARAVSPVGIGESISRLATNVKGLGEQLRTSMAENEAALTAALLPSEEERSRATQVRAKRARDRERAAGERPLVQDPDDEDTYEFF